MARIKTPDDHWYISTFYSRDYVIIDYNIARIKTPDDHWYISTFNSQDYVFIDYNIPASLFWQCYNHNYVVLAVKCRDIPMVVRRLYSCHVIVNHYVVQDVKCRDISMVVRRLYSDSQDYVIIDYNIARIKTPDVITLPE
jgi:hypothetical protein